MFLPLGDDLEKNHPSFATGTLIAINALIFAAMFGQGISAEFYSFSEPELNEPIEQFYRTWALVPADLAQGQVMGLISNMFLHGSIFHLVGNMLVLWAFGRSLENVMGSIPFVVLYLLWGVIASLTQCFMDFSSEVPLLGASGAIAGVIGAYLVMFGYAARIKILFLLGVFPFRFYVPALAFGGFWILSQLSNAAMDATGDLTGVAWMAHVGGFAVGVVTMFIFKNQTDRVLVRTANNELLFRSREEMAQLAEMEMQQANPELIEPEEPVIAAMSCSKCSSEVNESHQIGPRLLRCPNPDCGQLCYVDASQMHPTV